MHYNVAYRAKVVIVAHHDHLIQKHQAASLSAFLKYKNHVGLLMPNGSGKLRSGCKFDGDSIIRRSVARHPKEIGFFTDGTFTLHFWKIYAVLRVIIFSPFIAAKRLADLITTLRHLNDRGVPTAVVTRDRRYSDSVARELIQQVSQAGIRVVQRGALHEKLAFIDKQIAWLGSLNILSHS